MENRDWEKFGEEIRRNVQDAIDSRDYSMLNRTISDTVNGAVDYFSHTMRNVGNVVNENIRGQQEQAAQRRRQTEEQRRQADAQRWSQGEGQWSQANTQQRRQPGNAYSGGGYRYQGANYNSASGSLAYGSRMPAVYGATTPARIGGIGLSAVGYGIGGISVIGLLVILVIGIASGDMGIGFWGALVLTVIPTIIFGSAAVAGTRILGRVRRFRNYISTLGGREYCDIKELQAQSGKNKKYVVQDLERMIQKGWFKEGHLDSKKSCLMVTHKAYQQYTELMSRVEMEEQEKKKKAQEAQRQQAQSAAEQAAAAQEKANLSPEVREVIQAGENYIRKIRACNDAIPGEEISAKISRIELLVDKIFARVEQNPDTVSDLRRMMDYYLPTTVKLLEAYEDLDSQPVQGENIISSKREIEKTLDTLNVAFEKLLDSLFQDTAWDVSSDISVLHTMLAQEGLTEDGLKKQ